MSNARSIHPGYCPGAAPHTSPTASACRHMMSFASPVELMASQNHIANEEGWRGLEEYEQKYATCRPPSAYFARVRNRP